MMNIDTDSPYKHVMEVFRENQKVVDNFPYNACISLQPFYQYLKRRGGQDLKDNFLAQRVIQLLEAEPKLLDSPSIELLSEKKELLHSMLFGFFPSFLPGRKLGYIAQPFSRSPIYSSEDLQKLMLNEDIQVSINTKDDELGDRMIANACSQILNNLYQQNFQSTFPAVLSIKDKNTQLEQHFRLNIIADFVEVKPTKPLKKLTKEQIKDAMLLPFNVDRWLKLLPPENFVFSGLIFLYFTDITELEVISRLKDKMLGKHPTPFHEEIDFVQQQLRSYFNNANISMGMMSLDHSFSRMISEVYNISTSVLGPENINIKPEQIGGSVYQRVWQSKEIVIVEDLKKAENNTEVEKILLKKGIRSLLLYPSVNRDPRMNQIVELYSSKPKSFSQNSLQRLKALLPLVEAGLNRKREELDNGIASIIQDQFTNIHPSVYWKFRDTAINHLKKSERKLEDYSKLDPIAFSEVYPLYGQADIVSSSLHRNKAIQADLIDNLKLLEKTLNGISNHSQGHLKDYFFEKVKSINQEIQKSFSPSDETRVLDLLRLEIHPCLRKIQQSHSAKKDDLIQRYFDQLNPNLEVVYRFRKNFEDSVAMLNENIADILQSSDDKMQESLPHYFEKYKTDGVEYNIYLGQSLLHNQEFTPFHLRDFRIWQLKTMCDITRKVTELQESLPQPLTTAQLIFVYSDPLDIRFRLDEKHFDVDGAYNVRYEIIKKRIDKALIQGTKERLTQPGKIAIVYLHGKDRVEYLDYLQYLLQKGWITPNIEELELGKLQGVEGLKALRITVL